MSTKLPTGELVARAYAKRTLEGASLAAPVVTTLPDVETWKTTGALQVEGIVGSRIREHNIRDMVVSFGAWAARPGSDKPPYGQANELLEVLRASAFRDWAEGLELEVEPVGLYRPAWIQGAHPVTEPRRLPEPDTSRAHYVMDFRIIWVVA